jgi:hypothetical protein
MLVLRVLIALSAAAAAKRGRSHAWIMSMTKSRLASVYARDHDYIIQPSSWTITGLRIGSEPTEILDHDVAAASLGAALRRAQSAAKEGVEHPTDWKAHLLPLLQSAKIRSWNALQKSAKYCQVEALNHELRITPFRNGGTSGPDKGYHPIADHASTLPLHCSDKELGTAVISALSFCS